jgi:uncharacterized membrane protein HdeD (DUF308 family)
MMDKMIFWFSENRKKIGYTLGGLNIILGVDSLANGQTSNGLLMLFIGSFLIFDAWMFP